MGNRGFGVKRVVPVDLDEELIGTPTNPITVTVTGSSGGCDHAAVTSVPASLTAVTLLAANLNRRGASIENDSAACMYLKHGAGATSADRTVRVPPRRYYEVPFGYRGIITAVWTGATGKAHVTEFLP